jgi:hypothetical protein
MVRTNYLKFFRSPASDDPEKPRLVLRQWWIDENSKTDPPLGYWKDVEIEED